MRCSCGFGAIGGDAVVLVALHGRFFFVISGSNTCFYSGVIGFFMGFFVW